MTIKNTLTRRQYESVSATFNGRAREACPNCKKLLVADYGPEKSPFLLVRDFPGFEDIRSGVAHMEGLAGDAIRQEFMKKGLPWNQFRVTHFWKHGKDPKECDINFHLDRMVAQFKNRTHVFLMGNEMVPVLLGKSVASYAGLQLKLKEFPKIKFWVSPSPNVVFNSPLGDLILSIDRFSKSIAKG